jgi:hypothetical protein
VLDRFTHEDAALQVRVLGGGLDPKFSFRLRRPQGRVVDAIVFIKGRRTKHVAGENITRLTIARLPNRGRFKVKIVATSANGVKLVSKRTYRVCTKSKPKGKRVHPKR